METFLDLVEKDKPKKMREFLKEHGDEILEDKHIVFRIISECVEKGQIKMADTISSILFNRRDEGELWDEFLLFAVDNNNVHLVDFLTERSMEPNDETLSIAIERGYYNIATILREAGFNELEHSKMVRLALDAITDERKNDRQIIELLNYLRDNMSFFMNFENGRLLRSALAENRQELASYLRANNVGTQNQRNEEEKQNSLNVEEEENERESNYDEEVMKPLEQELINAIEKQDVEAVRRLLQNNEINIHVQNGLPLYLASKTGSAEIVRILLDAGALVNTDLDENLHLAITGGHIEVVKLLLQRGATVTLQDIQEARNTQNWDILELLEATYERQLQEISEIDSDLSVEEKQYSPRTERNEDFADIIERPNREIVQERSDEEYEDMLNQARKLANIRIPPPSARFAERSISPFEEELSLDTQLYRESERGNLQKVRSLVERGADIHVLDDLPVRLASENGHLEIVKFLYERGANIHERDDYAFCLASENGHLETARFLLDNGSDINADNGYPLRMASRDGHVEIVRLLLSRNANVHVMDDTPLTLASKNGHGEIVRLLLEYGANPSAHNNEAYRSAVENGYEEIANLLRNHLENEQKQNYSQPFAQERSDQEYEDLLNQARERATRQIEPPDSLRSQLIREQKQSNEEFVAHASRGDIQALNFENTSRETLEMALVEAIKNKQMAVIELLLKHDFDIDYLNGYPLYLACEAGLLEVAKMLIQAGANVHEERDEALWVATENGHTDIVRLLLENGASIQEGLIEMAESKGYSEIVALLQNAHEQAKTRLENSALSGDLKTVIDLLRQHDFSNENLNSALLRANTNNHRQISKILLELGADPDLANSRLVVFQDHSGEQWYSENNETVQNPTVIYYNDLDQPQLIEGRGHADSERFFRNLLEEEKEIASPELKADAPITEVPSLRLEEDLYSAPEQVIEEEDLYSAPEQVFEDLYSAPEQVIEEDLYSAPEQVIEEDLYSAPAQTYNDGEEIIESKEQPTLPVQPIQQLPVQQSLPVQQLPVSKQRNSFGSHLYSPPRIIVEPPPPTSFRPIQNQNKMIEEFLREQRNAPRSNSMVNEFLRPPPPSVLAKPQQPVNLEQFWQQPRVRQPRLERPRVAPSAQLERPRIDPNFERVWQEEQFHPEYYEQAFNRNPLQAFIPEESKVQGNNLFTFDTNHGLVVYTNDELLNAIHNARGNVIDLPNLGAVPVQDLERVVRQGSHNVDRGEVSDMQSHARELLRMVAPDKLFDQRHMY